MKSGLGSLRAISQSGTGIAFAMAIMNLASYGFTMIAARLLGPQPFGAFAAINNVLLVVTVVSLGLQTTAARRIAADPDHVGQIEREILRVTFRVALVGGIALILLSPAIDRLLQLDSIPTAALLGVAVMPTTLMGGQAGILQGERRWAPLGLLYVAAGIPRLVVGTLLIMWRPDEFAATLGLAIAAWVPALVGWWALRADRGTGTTSQSHGHASIVREVLRNSQTFLAFFALTNADLVVARNVLSNHDAGLYAAGLIVAKAVLFLPQFVVVVAFPALSTSHGRDQALRRGLTLTAAIGGLSTTATLALSGLALIFVGGSAYAEVQPHLWLWALLGTLMAMLQVIVYALLARESRRTAYLIWVALVVVGVAGLAADSVTGLLTTVLLVTTTLIVVLLISGSIRNRRSALARS